MKTTFHIPDRAVKLIRWGAFTTIIAIVALFVVAIVMAASQDGSSGDSQTDPRCSMTENWVVTDKTHGRVLYEELDLDSLETSRFWISCPDI
jgi:D-alanyl-D-alanine carboxypeptidase